MTHKHQFFMVENILPSRGPAMVSVVCIDPECGEVRHADSTGKVEIKKEGLSDRDELE